MRGDLDERLGQLARLARELAVIHEQRVVDALERDRFNAEDLDLEARRGVGEPHRLGPRRLTAKGSRERREHHVAGAGHVVHLARHRRQVHGRAALFEQQRAVLV